MLAMHSLHYHHNMPTIRSCTWPFDRVWMRRRSLVHRKWAYSQFCKEKSGSIWHLGRARKDHEDK